MLYTSTVDQMFQRGLAVAAIGVLCLIAAALAVWLVRQDCLPRTRRNYTAPMLLGLVGQLAGGIGGATSGFALLAQSGEISMTVAALGVGMFIAFALPPKVRSYRAHITLGHPDMQG